SYSWTGAPQLPLGGYTLTAEFAGLAQNSPRFESIQVFVTEPTVIGPGKTVTMSYFYIFNATGTFTIEPERVIYSSRQNVSLIFPRQRLRALLVREADAQSPAVLVTFPP